MRRESGMTYEAIASEVQSTPDAVRMAVRRAIETLAREMSGEP